MSGKGRLSLGDQILKEWATITGIDHTQLLSNKPEAKITQLQTLQDIISDVETDNVYQTVIKNSVGRPTKVRIMYNYAIIDHLNHLLAKFTSKINSTNSF